MRPRVSKGMLTKTLNAKSNGGEDERKRGTRLDGVANMPTVNMRYI